jgi:cbb3-type cytochrome oxidase cytochrome c subunit
MFRSRMLRMALLLLFVVAAGVGIAALFTEAQAKGPCRCPMVYAPVQCDHNKVYPNQCVADCHHAKNCVPIGII